MSRGWERWVGNIRSMVGNSMGGLRGGTNLASWVVAGTLAYYLWVKPSQDLKRQQQERAASNPQRSLGGKPEVRAPSRPSMPPNQTKDD